MAPETWSLIGWSHLLAIAVHLVCLSGLLLVDRCGRLTRPLRMLCAKSSPGAGDTEGNTNYNIRDTAFEPQADGCFTLGCDLKIESLP